MPEGAIRYPIVTATGNDAFQVWNTALLVSKQSVQVLESDTLRSPSSSLDAPNSLWEATNEKHEQVNNRCAPLLSLQLFSFSFIGKGFGFFSGGLGDLLVRG